MTPVPRTRYESETVKAVRQMVNGGKLYPKAISMKLEDELKYERKQSKKSTDSRSNGSRRSRNAPAGLDSAFETASTVSSKVNDNTLDFGDWTIMEPGNVKCSKTMRGVHADKPQAG